MKYLALGDSYTIGEGVKTAERWPIMLAHALGLPEDDVDIIATTGWTTGELIDALTATRPEPVYGVCSLLIGVNNQYRGLDLDEYAKEFKTLLSSALLLAQGHTQRTFVVSIPDWGVSPFAEQQDREAIAQQIDAFNRTNRALTLEEGIPYADITPLSRSLSQKQYFAKDGLHPSGAAYTLWVEEILQSIDFDFYKPIS